MASTRHESVHSAILLVSLASERCSQSLISVVRSMNFGLRSVTGPDWLADHSNGPMNTIVLVDSASDVRDNFVDALASQSSPRLLAMEQTRPSEYDGRLVSQFQDFMSWPCSDFEVKYRLDRLFSTEQESGLPNTSEVCDRLSKLGMVGCSSVFIGAMQELFEFAKCDVPVLIQGETGTGKELAARAIHESSSRAARPFVSVNCGAIPDNLIENELFGHEKGAFTDAKDSQRGLVAQAHGGTLFLDEVDTLSPVAQVALLRFLETQEYRPLGGRGSKLSDARVVAATNAELEKCVERGKFRRDLLFRLDVCGVTLPPLRERGSDIELLTNHFLARYAEKYQRPQKTAHPGMLEWMREFKWDGNVRELDNLLHRLFLLSKTPQIFAPKPMPGQSAASCDRTRGLPWSKIPYKQAKAEALGAFERSYLTWLMAETRGNLSLAARKTAQQRSSLRRLLQKHDIDKNVWKDP